MPEFSRIYRISTAKMEDEALSNAYAASFARGKKSGLSFGFYQNDVANNKEAGTAFEQLLVASGEFNGLEAERLKKRAAEHGVHAEKFTPEELTKINRALSCPAGREIVRGADEVQLQTLDRYVSQVISAANRNPQGIGVFHPTHPDHEKAIVLAAAWINRTDPPSTILEFVSGKSTTLNGNALQLQTAPSLEDLK